MSKFYTNVTRKGNLILERGYEDGQPYRREIKYKPYLFTTTDRDSIYTSAKDGKKVKKIEFESMYEAREYIQRYKDVNNHEIYGFTDYEFTYIYDNFPKIVPFDYSLINVINIDIETDSSNGFPDIAKANREINAITLAKGEETITLGFFPYDSTELNEYIQCKDEADLLRRFISIWKCEYWCPDIITGWNIEFFDIPYIINRIRVVLGENAALKLSPFKEIKEKLVEQRNGKMVQTYSITGISIIDYYAAYKKFASNERESYKLDYIADYELGQKKLDYSEYGSLNNLYVQNPQLYYKYNILDAVLIFRLENKLHYIEQIVNIAYVERVNFENTLTTVKPWDVIVHNYLMDQNKVVPHVSATESSYIIEGGYVKHPEPGLYKYVVSVDFTSLYPSIAMQYNISPETFVRQNRFSKEKIPEIIDKLLFSDMSETTRLLKERNYSMTANLCLFKREERGFIPALMKHFFDERKRVRLLEADAKKRYEIDNSDANRNEMLKHKNLQTAFKLINNSGYGAIANKYFRWFSEPLAEAITLSGQMTTKYVEAKVNQYLNKKFNTKDVNYVIYCDTDSAYITLEAYVNEKGITDIKTAIKAVVDYAEAELCPYIDSVCTELADRLNAYEMKTSMKLEKVCDQVFFSAKKRYALNVWYDEGIYYDTPKLKVTGLETVRSSVPKVCRKALEDSFKLIFKGNRPALIKYVDDFKKKFFELSIDEIGKPSSVKGLDKYYDANRLYTKGCPMHVRGSLVMNNFLEKNNLTDKYEIIQDHDKVKVCYLRLPNPTFENVISMKEDVSELDISLYLDYDVQYSKTFLEPLKAVCDAVGWETKVVYTLDNMFEN